MPNDSAVRYTYCHCRHHHHDNDSLSCHDDSCSHHYQPRSYMAVVHRGLSMVDIILQAVLPMGAEVEHLQVTHNAPQSQHLTPCRPKFHKLKLLWLLKQASLQHGRAVQL